MNTLLPEVLDVAKKKAAENNRMLVEVYTVHDQRCIWVSPSHAAILGYDPQELVGIHWKDIEWGIFTLQL